MSNRSNDATIRNNTTNALMIDDCSTIDDVDIILFYPIFGTGVVIPLLETRDDTAGASPQCAYGGYNEKLFVTSIPSTKPCDTTESQASTMESFIPIRIESSLFDENSSPLTACKPYAPILNALGEISQEIAESDEITKTLKGIVGSYLTTILDLHNPNYNELIGNNNITKYTHPPFTYKQISGIESLQSVKSYTMFSQNYQTSLIAPSILFSIRDSNGTRSIYFSKKLQDEIIKSLVISGSSTPPTVQYNVLPCTLLNGIDGFPSIYEALSLSESLLKTIFDSYNPFPNFTALSVNNNGITGFYFITRPPIPTFGEVTRNKPSKVDELFSSPLVSIAASSVSISPCVCNDGYIGTEICPRCGGKGYEPCIVCKGTGIKDDLPCQSCFGIKYMECHVCHGTKTVDRDECPICDNEPTVYIQPMTAVNPQSLSVSSMTTVQNVVEQDYIHSVIRITLANEVPAGYTFSLFIKRQASEQFGMLIPKTLSSASNYSVIILRQDRRTIDIDLVALNLMIGTQHSHATENAILSSIHGYMFSSMYSGSLDSGFRITTDFSDIEQRSYHGYVTKVDATTSLVSLSYPNTIDDITLEMLDPLFKETETYKWMLDCIDFYARTASEPYLVEWMQTYGVYVPHAEESSLDKLPVYMYSRSLTELSIEEINEEQAFYTQGLRGTLLQGGATFPLFESFLPSTVKGDSLPTTTIKLIEHKPQPVESLSLPLVKIESINPMSTTIDAEDIMGSPHVTNNSANENSSETTTDNSQKHLDILIKVLNKAEEYILQQFGVKYSKQLERFIIETPTQTITIQSIIERATKARSLFTGKTKPDVIYLAAELISLIRSCQESFMTLTTNGNISTLTLNLAIIGSNKSIQVSSEELLVYVSIAKAANLFLCLTEYCVYIVRILAQEYIGKRGKYNVAARFDNTTYENQFPVGIISYESVEQNESLETITSSKTLYPLIDSPTGIAQLSPTEHAVINKISDIKLPFYYTIEMKIPTIRVTESNLTPLFSFNKHMLDKAISGSGDIGSLLPIEEDIVSSYTELSELFKNDGFYIESANAINYESEEICNYNLFINAIENSKLTEQAYTKGKSVSIRVNTSHVLPYCVRSETLPIDTIDLSIEFNSGKPDVLTVSGSILSIEQSIIDGTSLDNLLTEYEPFLTSKLNASVTINDAATMIMTRISTLKKIKPDIQSTLSVFGFADHTVSSGLYESVLGAAMIIGITEQIVNNDTIEAIKSDITSHLSQKVWLTSADALNYNLFLSYRRSILTTAFLIASLREHGFTIPISAQPQNNICCYGFGGLFANSIKESKTSATRYRKTVAVLTHNDTPQRIYSLLYGDPEDKLTSTILKFNDTAHTVSIDVGKNVNPTIVPSSLSSISYSPTGLIGPQLQSWYTNYVTSLYTAIPSLQSVLSLNDAKAAVISSLGKTTTQMVDAKNRVYVALAKLINDKELTRITYGGSALFEKMIL